MEDEHLSWIDALRRLALDDGDFPLDAYLFLYEALDRAQKMVGERRHVSGRELLQGVRELAIEQFGPLTLMVFGHWNVHRTDDFGHMVFKLVDHGLMGKTDSDRLEDFVDVYDFRDAFCPDHLVASLDPRCLKPTFQPRTIRPTSPRPPVAQG